MELKSSDVRRKKRKRLFTPEKHYRAKDGHLCNSREERDIDDFLTNCGIPHKKPYGAKVGEYYKRSKHCPDWVINGVMVEYFGGVGFTKEYDKSSALKEEKLKNSKRPFVIIRKRDDYTRVILENFGHLTYTMKKIHEF